MTKWKRLEGTTRSEGIDEGLAARVADPLWMLGRQWQFGELRAEDTGSPVSVRVETSMWPLSSYTPRIERASDESVSEALQPGEALRARVEAEHLSRTDDASPSTYRHNVESGLQFLRFLDANGAGALRAAFIAAFRLLSPTPSDASGAQQRRALRRMNILARGSLDAAALLRAGVGVTTRIPAAADGSTREVAVPVALRPKARAAYRAWSAWHTQRIYEPPRGAQTAWRDRRLEHAFTVGAVVEGGPIAFGAAEYDGRNFDWSSFDLVPSGSGGDVDEPAPTTPPVSQVFELLPSPVTFRGMPAGRFWEMEDNAVSFGSIHTAPHDIARLLLIEHATVYSDDWFVVPVRARLGHVVTIDQLVVRNTFGETHTVKSKAELDASALGAAGRRWIFCEPTPSSSSASASLPAPLLLPPALSQAIEGDALERVDFVRDENANLAWGIERRVEDLLTRSKDRALEHQRAAEVTSVSAASSDAWLYRAETTAPPHFVPFVPERIADTSEMLLRRARLASWTEKDRPQGKILDDRKPLRLFEEEVQRGGVTVLRRVRLARDSDGKVHVWIARLKQPGRGDAASGLVFDTIDGMR